MRRRKQKLRESRNSHEEFIAILDRILEKGIWLEPEIRYFAVDVQFSATPPDLVEAKPIAIATSSSPLAYTESAPLLTLKKSKLFLLSREDRWITHQR